MFTRLVPILCVEDLDAERRFYETLGLRVTYDGPEYPDFIAIGDGGIEFGLERRPGPAEGWRYRSLTLRSPGGFRVVLEGPNE